MIAVLSLFANEMDRNLEERAEHLLSKKCKNHKVRWVWIVDSDDGTEEKLKELAKGNRSVKIVSHSEEVAKVVTTESSRARASKTATVLFSHIRNNDEFACLHESDLKTPGNVLDLFLSSGRGDPIAGWPTIELPQGEHFYDIWAYRDVLGNHFRQRPPYASGYTAGGRFRVNSFGSCWMVPAGMLKDREIEAEGVVELCKQWKDEGVTLWVDSRIAIEQPTELWSYA